MNRSLHEAAFRLQQQALVNGRIIDLLELRLWLAEDDKTVLVWAVYDCEVEVSVSFELPWQLRGRRFNAQTWYHLFVASLVSDGALH